jgi:hypothetical protein
MRNSFVQFPAISQEIFYGAQVPMIISEGGHGTRKPCMREGVILRKMFLELRAKNNFAVESLQLSI